MSAAQHAPWLRSGRSTAGFALKAAFAAAPCQPARWPTLRAAQHAPWLRSGRSTAGFALKAAVAAAPCQPARWTTLRHR